MFKSLYLKKNKRKFIKVRSNIWLRNKSRYKNLIKFLYLVRKFNRFFFRRNYFTNEILKHIGKKLSRFFKRKFKIYKHDYIINKYFKKARFLDFKYIKRIRNREKRKKSLASFIQPGRFFFGNEQYFQKYNTNKRLAFVSLVKVLSSELTKKSDNGFNSVINNSFWFFKSFKKRNVRFLIKTNRLSGYRLLKYIVLFSMHGNRRKLFNSFTDSCLNARFDVFKKFNLSLIFKSLVSSSDYPISVVSSTYKLFNFTLPQYGISLAASLFFRRLLFKQFFFFNINNVVKKVDAKFLRRSNNNFFLLSSRLLNEFLSLLKLFVEIRPWKKSGRTVSIPVPIKSDSRRSFVFAHWFKESISATPRVLPIGVQLFNEFSLVSRLEGDSVKKLSYLSRTISSNRALLRKSGLSVV